MTIVSSLSVLPETAHFQCVSSYLLVSILRWMQIIRNQHFSRSSSALSMCLYHPDILPLLFQTSTHFTFHFNGSKSRGRPKPTITDSVQIVSFLLFLPCLLFLGEWLHSWSSYRTLPPGYVDVKQVFRRYIMCKANRILYNTEG